jgi:hypothetical protein
MRINLASMTLGYRQAVGSLCFLVALLFLSVPQMEAAFSTPAALIGTATDSLDQQVATSGANVYVVWRENEVGATSLNAEIYFVRSTDGGVNFEAPQNISQTPGTSANPRIAASGNHVYLTFNDGGSSFLAHSENGGASFLPNINLTTTSAIQLGSSSWLAAAGENLYTVWRQGTAAGIEIFVGRFGSYGGSFLGSQSVSAPSFPIDPVVAASGNSVYVAWSEPVTGNSNDILFRRSTDRGVAFGPAVNISNNTGLSRFPAMAADGMNVWLVWIDRTPSVDDIFFARSADAGGLFESTVNLSNNATGSVEPTVTGRGNRVYVAWADVPSGAASHQRDIYLRASEDAGLTFAENQNLSGSTTIPSGFPRTVLTDSSVSAYWGESILLDNGGSQRDIFHVHQTIAVPIPPPSMLSLSPSSGMQTQSVDVDLSGAGFQSGSLLALSGTGVTVTGVECISPTAMKAKFSVALTAAPGGRNLTVTNPDGQSATMTGAFTVMSASALMLIEVTRADVNMAVGNGEFLAANSNASNSSFKSLLAHLENAERALLQQPADLARAINQIDAFYIKIGNLAKGKKPEITPALYTTLYTDYAAVMNSLGGTVKPAL